MEKRNVILYHSKKEKMGIVDMSYQSYTANQVINRAANDNTFPKKTLGVKLFKVSLWIAPLVAWALWALR